MEKHNKKNGKNKSDYQGDKKEKQVMIRDHKTKTSKETTKKKK